MNQLQKEYFLSVARTGSFGRSAYELYVSSSAISKQITALEAELGCTLFTRSAKGSQLTPAGEVFYNYFVEEDTRFINAMKSARKLSAEPDAVISLALPREWDIALKLNDLQQKLVEYSGVPALYELLDVNSLCRRLEGGAVDLVLCPRTMLENLHNTDSRDIAELHYAILFSENHPAAACERPAPPDFNDCSLVAVRSDSPHIIPYSVSTGLCKALGIEYRNIFDMVNFDTAVNCVEAGTGFMFADEWSRVLRNRNFRSIPIEQTFTVSLAWNRDNENSSLPRLAEAFRRILAAG